MHPFFKCVLYLAATGIVSFFLGRMLPKRWFSYDAAPYAPFDFEQNGRIYDRLAIRRWKDKLPDMSKILPRLIPSKSLPPKMTRAQVELMLRETCIAEFIHTLLCITGLGCVVLWKGPGGWAVYALYLAGNLPYNLIQRYNRPKLARILGRLQTKEKVGTEHEQSLDFKLQYRPGT